MLEASHFEQVSSVHVIHVIHYTGSLPLAGDVIYFDRLNSNRRFNKGRGE